jgi:hypothetical protein
VGGIEITHISEPKLDGGLPVILVRHSSKGVRGMRRTTRAMWRFKQLARRHTALTFWSIESWTAEGDLEAEKAILGAKGENPKMAKSHLRRGGGGGLWGPSGGCYKSFGLGRNPQMRIWVFYLFTRMNLVA